MGSLLTILVGLAVVLVATVFDAPGMTNQASPET
jgi:hypothetical protein